MKEERKKATDAKSWTVAVFMAGDSDLANAMNIDLLELQKVGSSPQVNVVVSQQTAPGEDATWFEIPRGTPDKPSRKKKVGSGSKGKVNLAQKLDEFLQRVLRQYPAEHYLLILWGHGSGLSFGDLAPRASRDRIALRQLAEVLENFRKARKDKLDILGFSSCAISKAEFALELREVARYLVSSQIGINSLMTWPFEDVVRRIVESPQVTPPSLAGQIVQCFEDSYEPPPVALTALDLEQSERLKGQVDKLADAILGALRTFDSSALSVAERKGLGDPKMWETTARSLREPDAFWNSMNMYQALLEALYAFPYEHEDLVDFFDFCRQVVGRGVLSGKAEEARKIAQDVLNAGVQPFVAYNVRAGSKLGALNGLSIIAPNFRDDDWVKDWEGQWKEDGGTCWLWAHTKWPQMIIELHGFSRLLPRTFIE